MTDLCPFRGRARGLHRARRPASPRPFGVRPAVTSVGRHPGCSSVLGAVGEEPDHSSPTWREDMSASSPQALDSLMYYARRWVSLEVRLADRMHFGPDAEPLMALARHAGPADSLPIAWLLSRRRAGCRASCSPRRCGGTPGSPRSSPGCGRSSCPRRPARGGPNGWRHPDGRLDGRGDVFVIFPEGQNWTPGRRAGLIRRLRQRGSVARARRAEELRNVLPPRSRGAWAGPGGSPRGRRDGDRSRRLRPGSRRLAGSWRLSPSPTGPSS